MATFQDAITAARELLNDEDSTAYRYDDSSLLSYANDALKEIALRRPDLFSVIGDIPCVAGTIQQAPTDSLFLMDIFQVKGGRVVTPTDRKTLAQFNRTWMTDTAGTAVNWIPHESDPNKFFLYPPAPAGQVLTGQYCQTPQVYLITDTIPLPDTYKPAITDYIVFRAEARDDEYVDNARAKLFYDAFAGIFGDSKQVKMASEAESRS